MSPDVYGRFTDSSSGMSDLGKRLNVAMPHAQLKTNVLWASKQGAVCIHSERI